MGEAKPSMCLNTSKTLRTSARNLPRKAVNSSGPPSACATPLHGSWCRPVYCLAPCPNASGCCFPIRSKAAGLTWQVLAGSVYPAYRLHRHIADCRPAPSTTATEPVDRKSYDYCQSSTVLLTRVPTARTGGAVRQAGTRSRDHRLAQTTLAEFAVRIAG